jgi:hypothetical protein
MQTLPSVANPSVLPVSYPAYFEVDVLWLSWGIMNHSDDWYWMMIYIQWWSIDKYDNWCIGIDNLWLTLIGIDFSIIIDNCHGGLLCNNQTFNHWNNNAIAMQIPIQIYHPSNTSIMYSNKHLS